jgi:hypothetical protein
VAERLPLDLQGVARPPHNVERVPVAAHRVKVQALDSARRPAEEQRMSLLGAVQRLVN